VARGKKRLKDNQNPPTEYYLPLKYQIKSIKAYINESRANVILPLALAGGEQFSLISSFILEGRQLELLQAFQSD